MKKPKSTKREKIFFIITLISVIVAVGAIVHAQTATQGHPISEIDFTTGSANGNLNMNEKNIYNVNQGEISFLYIKDPNAQIYQDSSNKEMIFYSNKAGIHTLSDLAHRISCSTVAETATTSGCDADASVTCSSGTLLGGGCEAWNFVYPDGTKGWNMCPYPGKITKSYPSGNTWNCQASNSDIGTTIYLKAYAICCS